jgi:hypothetical protein
VLQTVALLAALAPGGGPEFTVDRGPAARPARPALVVSLTPCVKVGAGRPARPARRLTMLSLPLLLVALTPAADGPGAFTVRPGTAVAPVPAPAPAPRPAGGFVVKPGVAPPAPKPAPKAAPKAAPPRVELLTDYARASARASATGQPLVVQVGLAYPLAHADAVSCAVPALAGFPRPSVVVAMPYEGVLWQRYVFVGSPAPADVETAVTTVRANPDPGGREPEVRRVSTPAPEASEPYRDPFGLHRHICDLCGWVWTHTRAANGSVAAHTCPNPDCGRRIVTDKYTGPKPPTQARAAGRPPSRNPVRRSADCPT